MCSFVANTLATERVSSDITMYSPVTKATCLHTHTHTLLMHSSSITCFQQAIPEMTVERTLSLLDECIGTAPRGAKAQDQKDANFGNAFGLMSIIRSGRLTTAPECVPKVCSTTHQHTHTHTHTHTLSRRNVIDSLTLTHSLTHSHLHTGT